MESTSRKVYYALKQLQFIGAENGFTAHSQGDSIYIEFPSGKTLKIADSEVQYQANEYLRSEIEMVNF